MAEKQSIYDELMKVSGLKRTKGEDEQAFRVRLQKSISEEISEDDWNGLSSEAQDWSNDGAKAIGAKQPIPDIPGAPGEEKDEKPTGRRRGTAAAAKKEPEVGDHVLVTTGRGKVLEGVLVELDDTSGVVNKDGVDGDEENDIEFPLKGATIALSNTAEAAEAEGKDVVQADKAHVDAERKSKNTEPEEQAEQEGDTVQVITGRGKTIMGKIVSMNDEDMVLVDSTGEEHELTRSKLKEVKIKTRGARTNNADVNAAAGGKPSTRRRAGVDAPANEPGTPAADHDGGDSKNEETGGGRNNIGVKVRDYMMDNPGTTYEQLKKWLDKSKIDYREATAKMLHKDTAYVMEGMGKRSKK